MQTKITREIWHDPDFIELNDESKLIFFWMLTNCDQSGFIEVTERKLRRDIDSGYDNFEGLMKGLPRAFVKVGNVVWIRNYIAHQLGRGESLRRNNITKWVARDVSTKPQEWHLVVLDEYPEIAELIDKELAKKEKPLPSPYQGQRDRDRGGDGGSDRVRGTDDEHINNNKYDVPTVPASRGTYVEVDDYDEEPF